ncbi:MAG: tRNA uridine-5-carboxymethylaminomethyl(34) synthesis GTPase MnmE [Rhizobiales bacterium PAR1]|nr:MAG: tRNA uridine-5-carboxymethylaminomethyl(34) synthesis GTPase MnmE [Rhizobiales bacterium PAR1]
MADDTIFALSTGSGASGIAIIRVSGRQSCRALLALCGDLPPPRHAALRTIRDPADGHEIDSGVILFFPGPASFTGEDLVEFQVHGSIAVVRHLMRCLSELGLRAAEAGEFSQRAFFHGKMDLVDIEALGDLLRAETEAQARLSQVYRRNLQTSAKVWRQALVDISALTEAYIDFSDEGDVAASVDSQTEQEIRALAVDIERALSTLDQGERIRRGCRIVIAGPPNAGKSSLINALAARDVAITSPIPGTTRDTIEVHLDLKGFPVVLIDTAGLRESVDPIENLGIQRALSAAASADLVLWLSPSDHLTTPAIDGALIVQTKIDLIDSLPEHNKNHLAVSTTTGRGLEDLIEVLGRHARSVLERGADNVLVAHERQASELRHAAGALYRALAVSSEALEIRAEELRIVGRYLDRLTGRIEYDEVLGTIFSRFCIGK